MPSSVLEAIKEGQWDFEPDEIVTQQFAATRALPGSPEKLSVLAERVRRGLPLWHPGDRLDWEETVDSLSKS